MAKEESTNNVIDLEEREVIIEDLDKKYEGLGIKDGFKIIGRGIKESKAAKIIIGTIAVVAVGGLALTLIGLSGGEDDDTDVEEDDDDDLIIDVECAEVE